MTQLSLPQSGTPPFSAHVRCGQTAEWTKMLLGMEVGLGPGDFVLDGDAASPRKRSKPSPIQCSAHVYCGQTARWVKTPVSMEVDLGPSPATRTGHSSSPLFSAHVYCGHGRPPQLLLSSCRPHCVRLVPAAPTERRTAAPTFTQACVRKPWPVSIVMSIVTKRLHQDITWYRGRHVPGDIVLDGDSAPPRNGAQQPLHFWPMFIVAKWSPSQQLRSSLFIYCW